MAYIAYSQLDDADRDRVAQLLGQCPHQDIWFHKNQPAGVDQRLWLFLQGATWPDFVRDHEKELYHQAKWHYINLPIVAPGTQCEHAPANPLTNHQPNVVRIIDACAAGQLNVLDAFRKPQSQAISKPMSIAWLLHTIGDIHQPLHTVALFRSDLCHGDEGGNLLFVNWQGEPQISPQSPQFAKEHNLHKFWDGCLGDEDNEKLDQVKAFGDALLSGSSTGPAALAVAAGESNTLAWADEGKKIGEEFAYQIGVLTLSKDQDHRTDLTAEYQAKTREIAKHRMALAGYRLAKALHALPQ